jgi:hypothetical protein
MILGTAVLSFIIREPVAGWLVNSTVPEMLNVFVAWSQDDATGERDSIEHVMTILHVVDPAPGCP